MKIIKNARSPSCVPVVGVLRGNSAAASPAAPAGCPRPDRGLLTETAARRSARAGLRSTRWPQTKKRWNSMPATTAPTSRSAKTTSGEFTTVSGELLPAGFKRKEIVLFSDGKRIEELIPARCAAKPTRSRKTLRHEIARAAGHAGGSVPADRRTRRTPHRPVAKSRILFRTETEPLGVAAGTYFRDRRRPLHAELRAALPGFDAGKRRGLRPDAARTRRTDRRGDRRQRPGDSGRVALRKSETGRNLDDRRGARLRLTNNPATRMPSPFRDGTFRGQDRRSSGRRQHGSWTPDIPKAAGMPFTSPIKHCRTARTMRSTRFATKVERPVSASTKRWAAAHGSTSGTSISMRDVPNRAALR